MNKPRPHSKMGHNQIQIPNSYLNSTHRSANNRSPLIIIEQQKKTKYIYIYINPKISKYAHTYYIVVVEIITNNNKLNYKNEFFFIIICSTCILVE